MNEVVQGVAGGNSGTSSSLLVVVLKLLPVYLQER